MIRIAIFFIFLMIYGLGSAQKSEQIFNGKDLSNWEIILADDSKLPNEVFYVSDGLLNSAGIPNGYVRTKKIYKNFELSLEWRWPEKPSNSGVLLFIDKSDKVWPNCIEAQLQHGNAGNLVLMNTGAKATINGKDYELKEGDSWVSSIKKLNDSSEKEQGEWNQYRIVSKDGKLEYYVNGVLQNSATNIFPTEGYIGLQSEGGLIQFRNVFIKEL